MISSATIGSYEALYFESVAQAVEFCHALVPHIVARTGVVDAAGGRAVVWFHVPARSRTSTRDGCYLFASGGAMAAAERAGLDVPVCGRVARAALPADAVLLFGDDIPPVQPRLAHGRRGKDSRTPVDATLSVRGVDLRV